MTNTLFKNIIYKILDAFSKSSVKVQLENAKELHAQFPDSFQLPDSISLNALRPGSHVKLCASGERFWVLVQTVDGIHITGTVDNDLLSTNDHGLKYGDVITFNTDHVYDISV